MEKNHPEKTFTPRSASVNQAMYVPRPDLEDALKRALRGTHHVIVHGESGSGKSWLYKQVFEEESVVATTLNMALASRFGDLNQAFTNMVDRERASENTSYTEEKSAGISGTKLGNVRSYRIGSKEPFEKCLELVRDKANKKTACMVLENFESIFGNQKLLDQLADTLILLDDQQYARYDVKIIIVGVPNDLRSYFARIPNRNTVSNRLVEIPEVARLTAEQGKDLINRGLFGQLNYESTINIESLFSHILWITDRVPQQLQEYCLELARLADVNNGQIDVGTLAAANRIWVNGSLMSNYSAIESAMSARDIGTGRRNQTIYAMGQFDGEQFNDSDIESIVRTEFTTNTRNSTLHIAKVLTELAKADNAIIRKTTKGDEYRFTNPKLRMCIRAMLRKSPSDGRVEKVEAHAIG